MTLSSLLLAAASTGCSLVYDADDLRAGRDGGGADAGPDDLFVARVAPAAVLEGEGSSFVPEQEGMVRAIPIVLEGQNMTADTVFSIEGLGLDGAIEAVAVSGDGHFAAFALRVPIDPALGDGDQSQDLAIRLAKGGEEASAPLVDVTGLDALVVGDGGMLDSDRLHARYTHVDLSGDVVARGTAPIRIVATAGIRLGGALRADAGEAPDPGPGGCAGGGVAAAADCGAGSGQGGESSGTPGGGGGGGYGSPGTPGTGGQGQEGGMAGQRFVAGADAHGAGGGGGGELTLGAGGPGGGSGGAVELTTPAVLSMAAGALVSAAGGDGAAPIGGCPAGGGGGGGSGGAVLLRAGRLAASAGAAATALGGSGAGGGACAGGDGGDGRIRIDRGSGAAIAATPAAYIGPMPVIDDLDVIVDAAALAVPVRGAATRSYELYVNEQETPATFETDGDGVGTAEVTLQPGLNTLCVYVADRTEFDLPEAKNCVNVAYIEP